MTNAARKMMDMAMMFGMMMYMCRMFLMPNSYSFSMDPACISA